MTAKPTRKPSKRKDYIPNQLFHEEMLKWRLLLLEDPKAQVPEILAGETKSGYVNNIQLYKHFVLWKQKLKLDPKTQMPNFIGQAVINISNGLIKNYKFNRYTWKEEMVGDAIINCVKYACKYDDELYTNPHAYLSMCCEQMFVQRIKKEKREYAGRYKHFVKEVFDLDMVDTGKVDYNFYLDLNSKVHEYEKTLKTKKLPKDMTACVYDLPEDILTSLEEAMLECSINE